MSISPQVRSFCPGISSRPLLFLRGVCFVIAGLGAMSAAGCHTDVSAPAPIQPVAFSHKTHAGENHLDCQFCHTAAHRSPVAGVPSLQRCADCHRPMAAKDPGAAADNPDLKKLLEVLEKKQPIAWVRVHDLPDHTYFSHRAHVHAEVACQSCHGPVETMERVKQVSSLSMGWCVSCHRQQKASLDCLTCHK